uniref:Uncharacterized protein n=1 Tax=Meloidogyne enterolobii TaxID=390850 RepID=A0A6V7XGG5_MELEN|nr:unnamed protein product [Meloidogyne enterolobii]CAD2198419.1 unnamed protein product [Meloidogyne enterolobii]
MIYYQRNLFLLLTVCIVSLTLAINVQNMNDLQRNHLIEREFPGENILNAESQLQRQVHTMDEEMLGRVEAQLMGAMEMLQNYRPLPHQQNLQRKERTTNLNSFDLDDENEKIKD